MKKQLIFIILIFTFGSCYKESVQIEEQIFEEIPEVIIDSTNVVINILSETGEITDYNSISVTNGELLAPQNKNIFKCTNSNKYAAPISIIDKNNLKFNYLINNKANKTNYHSIYIPTITDEFPYKSNQLLKVTPFENFEITLEEESVINNLGSVDQTNIYLATISESNLHTLPYPLFITNELQNNFIEFSRGFYLGIGTFDENLLCTNFKIKNTLAETFFHYNSKTESWEEFSDTKELKSGFYAFGSRVKGMYSEVVLQSDEKPLNINISATQNDYKHFYGLSDQLESIIFIPETSKNTITISSQMNNTLKEEIKDSASEIFIDLSFPSNNLKTVFPTPVDCERNFLHNSSLLVNMENTQHSFIIAKNTSIEFYQENDLDISFQIRNAIGSTSQLVLENSINYYLGTQYLCPDVNTDYIYLKTDSGEDLLTDIDIQITPEEIILIGHDVDAKSTLKIKEKSKGDINDMSLNILYDSSLNKKYKLNCLESEEGCGFETFRVLHYSETAGNIIRGEFTGSFWIESALDQDVGYRKLSGEFQVQIQ